MSATKKPITPPKTFVITSVISDAPIDIIYCIISKNKLTTRKIKNAWLILIPQLI